jgi:hypothetical protein
LLDEKGVRGAFGNEFVDARISWHHLAICERTGNGDAGKRDCHKGEDSKMHDGNNLQILWVDGRKMAMSSCQREILIQQSRGTVSLDGREDLKSVWEAGRQVGIWDGSGRLVAGECVRFK